MKPMFWLYLYTFFLSILFLFCVFNYFNSLNLSNNIIKNSAKSKFTSWKW